MKFFFIFIFIGTLGLSAKEVLFIGNSYTMQSRETLQQMLKAEGAVWNMTFITKGGFTLDRHLQNSQNIDLMKSKKWDAIILQEQSQTPAYSSSRKGYFASLAKIQKMFKKDKTPIYLFTSWGRRDGDTRNLKAAPTYEKMQGMLDEAFAQGARKYKMKSLPINQIWGAVMKKDLKFGKDLYKMDGSHPSAKGAYLVALSIFCTLESKSPREVKFQGQLTEAEFKLLRDLASKMF